VFGFIPSPSNFIRPFKRPLSSITPIIVESANGSLYYVVGAAGGSRIPTASIQALWHVLDRNMSLYDALEQPRLHDQLMPDNSMLEWAFDNGTASFLKGRGHNVTYVRPGFSTVHAVRLWGNGTFEAVGEPRQKNSAGYAV
jgi:gamma-glutamyltranspeptidase/glutathione hydrolase